MCKDKTGTTQYMTIKEAAQKWHTNPGYLRKACALGQVSGAAKLGNEWIIPADMERPPMKVPREKVPPKKIEHGSAYKDQIYKMTMEGFPDFNVVTMEIGRTTYVVYGSFSPKASETLEEKLLRISLRQAGEELGMPGLTLDAETKRKVREEALSKLPSNEKLREYYRTKFLEIGFNDEELAVLMSKIDEHIATRDAVLKRK